LHSKQRQRLSTWYIEFFFKHATAAYQDLRLAGLTQGTSTIKATDAQVTFVATLIEQWIKCEYCGGTHAIEVCRKLQAAQAKPNATVLHARMMSFLRRQLPTSTTKLHSVDIKAKFARKTITHPTLGCSKEHQRQSPERNLK